MFCFIFCTACENSDDFKFQGMWQSLNDQASVIEFSGEGKIILLRNGVSFWAQTTMHGELNYCITKQEGEWYKFVTKDGDQVCFNGRIEIVNRDRIRIYIHKHHNILDIADEYQRTDYLNNFSTIMNEILRQTDTPE